jgi:hypothetical protein
MRSEILSIVAIIGLLPCAGGAQEAGGTVACPSIQNDQERLACYDRSLRSAQPPPAAPPVASAPAPTPAAAPAAVAAPVVVGAAAATPPPAAATVAPPAPAAVAPPPPAAAPAPAASSASPTPGGAGGAAAATTAVAAAAASQPSAAAAAATPQSTISTAPHNSRNKHAGSPAAPDAPPTIDPATGQPTGVIPIVVLSTRIRPGFPTEFTTDKLGVWVQGETKPLPALPKAPFNAQLEPGTFGGAFLVVPDRKLGVRVHAPDR